MIIEWLCMQSYIYVYIYIHITHTLSKAVFLGGTLNMLSSHDNTLPELCHPTWFHDIQDDSCGYSKTIVMFYNVLYPFLDTKKSRRQRCPHGISLPLHRVNVFPDFKGKELPGSGMILVNHDISPTSPNLRILISSMIRPIFWEVSDSWSTCSGLWDADRSLRERALESHTSLGSQ